MNRNLSEVPQSTRNNQTVSGGFINFFDDERYYTIENFDKIPSFFISVVSDSDHWLFISSNGGLTAGRVSPETAIFPYVSVDKIHESSSYTGCKTIMRVEANKSTLNWEPFNREHDGRYQISRNLYKNLLGNKLCFEEINHDLQLSYRYFWMSSDEFGFVRHCELQNLSDQTVRVDLLDGLQNILPAGTPRLLQSSSSNLIDAYKWTEYDNSSKLGLFTLNSGITDRPEPCESLKANTVFYLGLGHPKVLISSLQLDKFRRGEILQAEDHKRGIRGAYFVNEVLNVKPKALHQWQFVANTEQTQAQVVALSRRLKDPDIVKQAVFESIETGSDQLSKIMASADGFQLVREENVAVHHYANVLFNIQRGGGFVDQYRVNSADFSKTVRHFNQAVYQRNQVFINNLPSTINFVDLLGRVQGQIDASLERLCYEYLPISFGRRHGDPSRPWNQFAILLKDEAGKPLLSYQGNWRDIFQNWEALALSYPDFVENMIAKFVNASTVDGYNPYRITKQGIDWEIEDKDDPWSHIGYWGDHQIIYLLKLLEQSLDFHPQRLGELLRRPIFCYANVPYRINAFDKLIRNAKDTVVFDQTLADQIDQRVESMGADGKLLLNDNGDVYQVNLLEKLLVALLCKLGNLVVDGGIWLNTQRPEWNDANNALVGQGLSMVTLYYLRRYVRFVQNLLELEAKPVALSSEVNLWFKQTAISLAKIQPELTDTNISHEQRYATLVELGNAASEYRHAVYQIGCFSHQEDQSIDSIQQMLKHALAVIDHSIDCNCGDDGLYQAYNLMDLQADSVAIKHLYPMLEGQVSALSSGAVQPERVVSVLEALFDSDLYRADQESFILYPDRQLPGFLSKNQISELEVLKVPLASRMLATGDETILLQDEEGCHRFNAEIINLAVLDSRLDKLSDVYGNDLEAARESFRQLYESVFNHGAYTGRSGGMFGFEGLGSIYWHMVSKLLLVVQENYFSAIEQNTDAGICQQIGDLYYRVRQGIGFNKTPEQYGAFPTDPYSHTPKHAGARQPGMTGQVKEEILSRFGELGVLVKRGAVHFHFGLLRRREFISDPLPFRYLDVDNEWQTIVVPAFGLAFTWCQVPIVYCLNDDLSPGIKVSWVDGKQQDLQELRLTEAMSAELFSRNNSIRQINLTLNSDLLFVNKD
jgi:hypothetical protein